MPSKQKVAYFRKLYLAHLIANQRHDQLTLEQDTGMPRRTVQDAIKAMVDIGIECSFVQDGPKHRHGFYRIDDWGDHKPEWVAQNLEAIRSVLGV